MSSPLLLNVLVVGAGLGGLTSAIACRHAGCNVTVLEKAPALIELGAGIQITPNASKIMRHYGLLDKLMAAGADKLGVTRIIDYQSGETIDYHKALAKEATDLGAHIRFGCGVKEVRCTETPSLTLENGEELEADLILGADGIGSVVREFVYGKEAPFVARNEVAYRAVIPRDRLAALEGGVLERLESGDAAMWMWVGPGQHVASYKLRGGSVFNVAIIAHDDLPEGLSKTTADREKMEAECKGWDPILGDIIRGAATSVTKWKVVEMNELETWTKGHVLLLGDSCHPTPPYQAQGSAMAVEDAACLATLLQMNAQRQKKLDLTQLLDLHCDIRKRRTALQTKGMLSNADLFQLQDEQGKAERRRMMAETAFNHEAAVSRWTWGDMKYQLELNDYDVFADTVRSFRGRFGDE